ncbi:hypothetical protein [Streptomyces filamentosus]|uniref:hypothetical protein n=1 Tax=Streptomyces filamentosus TaxID=67294 RepID=UPI0033E886AC
MSKIVPITADSLIAKHAADIATITGEPAATTLSDFADQLRTAAGLVERVGINGGDELEDAAVYLNDVATATPDRQQALLETAAEHLKDVDDIADEYRLC